jgi:ubiquinone/menaquinone biosynthesis C-methylase UbiE
MVNMQDKVELWQGNALRIPFEDQSFNIVWTEHVQMNIADKKKFY